MAEPKRARKRATKKVAKKVARKVAKKAAKRVVHQGSLSVTSQVNRENSDQTISRTFDCPFTNNPNPAVVGLKGGITKNMGDYNSVKVEVFASVPCDPTAESMRKAKGFLSEMVDEFMDEEYSKAIT